MIKFVFISTIAFISFAANAKTVDLRNDKNIFEATANAFPSLVEQVGNGFSKEIYVKSLHCYSNQDEDECIVITFENQTFNLHSDDDQNAWSKISQLQKALEKGGVKSETTQTEIDGIGVTAFTISNFDCARIEPKPSSPQDKIKVRYSCTHEE